MRVHLALLLCSLSLAAQDRYIMWDKTKDYCPRHEQLGSSPYQPTETYTWQTGTRFLPPDQRSDASLFTIQDEAGKAVSLKEFRGKPIIVVLWSTRCEPSLYLLGEMVQLNGQAAKFGFEAFATNYDRERWGIIRPFLDQQRMKTMLKGVKIFTPSIGEGGIHVFMKVIPVLPTFFLVDREGRMAVQSMGYKAGELSKWLKVLLAEPAPQTPNPVSAPKTTSGGRP